MEAQPPRIEIEEYSHFGMLMRLMAGAANLSFMPLRTYTGSQIAQVNPQIAQVTCPYTGEIYNTVPALRLDVAIVHAQCVDAEGNAHIWGLLGAQKEAAFAASRVIVVAEQIVPTASIRADPNRTLIPGLIVDAVVHEPFGAHPSYVHGYYDRDNAFYNAWDAISRDPDALERYLAEMVYGVADREEYAAKLGREALLQQVPPGWRQPEWT